MKFYDKLKTLMHMANSTSRELAEKVGGVSKTTVSNWLNGSAKPGLDSAFAIARTFGVSLDWLADDSADWPPPHLAPQTQELPYEDKMILDIRRALRLSLDEAIRGLALMTKDQSHLEAFAKNRDLLAGVLRFGSPDARASLGIPGEETDLAIVLEKIELYRSLEKEIDEWMAQAENEPPPAIEPISEEQTGKYQELYDRLRAKRKREKKEFPDKGPSGLE